MAHVEPANGELRITVMRSLAARQIEETQLVMASGATVSDALRLCGWWSADSGELAPVVGVWGKLRPLNHLLRDFDRVELYRGLRVDPKEARRERYAGHKARIAITEKLAAQRKRPR